MLAAPCPAHRIDSYEAKDTDDKLDAEISKKIAKGYPLNNTIFEDTRQAVLFQGKREVRRTDITDPQNLADLLNHFYAYTEPEHEDFEQAVEEFRERVPDLARNTPQSSPVSFLSPLLASQGCPV
jgi:hypothetical protein